MESIYIIQTPEGYAISAAYEESKAIDICQSMNKTAKGHTYRSIPFCKNETTEITVISHAKITNS